MRVEPAVGKTEKAKQVLNELASFAYYDPDTGKFIATRQRRRNSAPIGQPIGTQNPRYDYLWVSINMCVHRLHHLAWLWMTGDFPQHEIDHINGNVTDNSWKNLRDVPRHINSANKRKQINNTSGQTGVSFDKDRGLWKAQVKYNGVLYGLGRHTTIEKAVEARNNFIQREQLPFTERHGK